MLLYKYRGGNNDTFERDLNALKHNFLYAPSHDQLNDPCETLVLTDKFHLQLKIIFKLFPKANIDDKQGLTSSHQNLIDQKNNVGIYAMSRTFNHELLWAYYANSHRGFCIEFDSEELVEKNIYDKKYFLEVSYSKRPPQLGLEYLDKRDEDLIKIIGKLAGTKSKKWKHEEEVRLITDKKGIHSYNHKAIKAIYLGVKMPDEHKNMLFETLKGRGIHFYQMKQKKGLYEFEEKLTLDSYIDEQSYLNKIPEKLNNGNQCGIKILDIKYHPTHKKGTIDIGVERAVTKKALKWLANTIKNELFYTAEKVFIGYRLKGVDSGAYWASTHFTPKLEISIAGINEDEWSRMLSFKVTGKIIASWKNREAYTESVTHLVEEKGKMLMKVISKGCVESVEELMEERLKNTVKYSYLNNHGEYYIIEGNGNLGYYSADGKWMEAQRID